MTARGLVLLLLGCALAMAGPASAAGPNGCTSNSQADLQADISDATCPVVTVLPGTYAGAFEVTRNVVINGPNVGIPGASTRKPEAVISGTTGFSLEASSIVVTIDGFSLSVTDTGVDSVSTLMVPTIRNNRMTSGQRGVWAKASNGNWTVTGNRMSNMGAAGVVVAAATTTVNAHSNTIVSSDSGLLATAGTLIAHFNRLVDSSPALDTDDALTIDAENNWFGCNEGPEGTDCSPVQGTNLDTDPWLILSATAATNPATRPCSATVTGDLRVNSDGDNTSSQGTIATGTPVAFTASIGTASPAAGQTGAGTASTTITGPPCSASGQGSVTVDNETLVTPFTLGAAAPLVGSGPLLDTTAPVARALALAPSAFPAAARGASVAARKRKPGTTVRYRLSESATVRFTVQAQRAGRRVGKKCRRPTRSNRKRRKCKRYVTLKGAFSHAGKQGQNSFRFTGRLRGRKLRPGRYRLVAIPADASRNRGAAQRKRFRIIR